MAVGDVEVALILVDVIVVGTGCAVTRSEADTGLQLGVCENGCLEDRGIYDLRVADVE